MPTIINGTTGVSQVQSTADLTTNVKTALNASGSAPIYACRAWVNFDGTGTAGYKTGTYVQSGTTVTATVTNHGYVVGSSAKVDITSGTGVDGTYVVTGVTNANTFTYTAGTSLTTSGNITLQQNAIRASGNVSSITDNGVGDYAINFTTSMTDANYCVHYTHEGQSTSTGTAIANTLNTQVSVYSGSNNAVYDAISNFVAIFR